MKKFILFALLLLLWIDKSLAQQAVRPNAFSFELGGGSTLLGVSYERRIPAHIQWGYTVGVSYGYSGSSTFIGNNSDTTHGWAFPFSFNYLLGTRTSKLELGVGASLGYYHNKVKPIATTEESGEENKKSMPDVSYQRRKDIFGYYLFVNAGYRYISKVGVIFRVGVSRSFNFNDSHGINKRGFIPYIGVGYTF